jgi:hypothetical protein
MGPEEFSAMYGMATSKASANGPARPLHLSDHRFLFLRRVSHICYAYKIRRLSFSMCQLKKTRNAENNDSHLLRMSSPHKGEGQAFKLGEITFIRRPFRPYHLNSGLDKFEEIGCTHA